MNTSAQTEADEPRLPLIDEPGDSETASMFETVRSRTGRLLNLHRMMGYAPSVALASLEMALAFRQGARLPRTLVELMILRTAQSLASHYELHQHLPMALANGLSQLQIDALPRWRDSSLFAAAERAALAFCDGVLGKAKIDDQSFAELRRHFSAREIVELAMLVCQYVATAYFVRALRVPLETAQGSNQMPKASGIRAAPKRIIEAGRTTVEGVGALAEATALSAAKAATGALARTVRRARELVERQNEKRTVRKAKRKKASATKSAGKRTAKARTTAKGVKAAKARKSSKTRRGTPPRRRVAAVRRRSA